MSNDLIALLHQGRAFHQAGRLAEAEGAYRSVLARDARQVDALALLGTLYLQLRRFDDAERALGRSLQIQPDQPTVLNNRGYALELLRRYDEALASYAKALVLKPDYAEAFFNRGNTLKKQGRDTDALAAYDRAIGLWPGFAQALINRGNSLRSLGRLDEALASYDKAIALKPGVAAAHDNRGIALEEMERFPEALEAFDRAIAADPAYHDAYGNKSLVALRCGDFETGWPLYEWRWKNSNFTSARRNFAQPMWLGTEPLDGKTILLHAEQGLGDTIHFCRYASLVAARGAKVVLEAPRHLTRLLRSLAGVTTIVASGDTVPAFDFHCPLMSLPLCFGTTVSAVPADVPYLNAEPDRVANWRALLPPTGLRIGINWQGNPASKVDRGRSVPLSLFAPLARFPGVHLVSLQKNHGLDQLDRLPAGMSVQTLGADFDNGPDAFLDTAAVMMSLDLVITIDSAIAHLGGALGRPVWLALKRVPHWVWMVERADNPWYPTVRLFRQKTSGDYDDLFQRMGTALSTMTA
jgi:tetratricopeptide (TPR) repeat protein